MGGLLITTTHGVSIISFTIVGMAILGWLVSLSIPKAKVAAPHLTVNFNFIAATWDIVKYTHRHRDVFLAILGISWFWLVGFTLMTQFPYYTSSVIGGNAHIVTLFYVVFTVGIGVGSLLCNKLLKGEINAKYVPLGVFGMSIFLFDLYFTSKFLPHYAHTIGFIAFLEATINWHILLDLLFLSISGGIYIVPLYAILQTRVSAAHRSRTIACNNIISSLFMVAAAIFSMLLFALNFTVTQIFLAVGILNTFVALYICKLIPEALVKSFACWILKALYQVEIKGMENYKAAGNKIIIIANHTSYLDGILIAAFLPDKLTFAINTHITKAWWAKPFLFFADFFPIDATNPMTTKSIIKLIRMGRKCVIFPEGRVTMTGSLMKVYEGPGLVASKSGAKLLPVRIDGAQYTPFTRLRGLLTIRWFPKITLTIQPPRKFSEELPKNIRQRRRKIAEDIYSFMTDMMFTSSDYKQLVFQKLLRSRTLHKGRHNIIEDIQRKALSYNQLITRAVILGRKMCETTVSREYVGLMLPTSNMAMISFFGLHCYGRVPAMLNYSSGLADLRAACQAAKLRTIFTSKRFVKLSNLSDILNALSKEGINILYLEDLNKKISYLARVRGFIHSKFIKMTFKKLTEYISPDEPAVVLFTSGTEGTPKGVVLSHTNILANCYQLSAIIDFNSRDQMFNALPVFHSFGLIAGSLLPIITGIRTFFYPSPMHYRIIPELVYDTNSTVMFATNTFLAGYARYAHPYDFYSIRYMFAGAEKLTPDTRHQWSEKFGIRILEGYGATEASPVIATNSPMHYKTDTVGRMLPGVKYKIKEVPGITDGGRLFVSGPNVMLGYLRAENPGVLEPPKDGWHDTGDIVSLDDEGYIKIIGRAKRFAKIGGEMISLKAIELHIHNLWPDHQHAIVNVSDLRKGEQLVLFTDYSKAKRKDIVDYYQQSLISELHLPKKIITLSQMPMLTTGKVDYSSLKEQV